MKIIPYTELLELASKYTKNSITWHHHFLTPTCNLNDSDEFKIILENEVTHESVCSLFTERPMDELEKLENIFFKRVS